MLSSPLVSFRSATASFSLYEALSEAGYLRVKWHSISVRTAEVQMQQQSPLNVHDCLEKPPGPLYARPLRNWVAKTLSTEIGLNHAKHWR
jgi:hypothetical protein